MTPLAYGKQGTERKRGRHTSVCFPRYYMGYRSTKRLTYLNAMLWFDLLLLKLGQINLQNTVFNLG